MDKNEDTGILMTPTLQKRLNVRARKASLSERTLERNLVIPADV